MKHGVIEFVKAFGRRLAKENIRVDAICPGPVDTPMLRVFVARPDQQSTHGFDREQLVARRGDTIPMGRPGSPMGRPGRPEEIDVLEAFIVDLNGQLRGKWVPVRSAAKVMKGQLRFPSSSFSLDVWGNEVPASGIGAATGSPIERLNFRRGVFMGVDFKFT